MWSRVEGSRCDPNPNEEFSRPDGESLFGNDGKLTPSITILGNVLSCAINILNQWYSDTLGATKSVCLYRRGVHSGLMFNRFLGMFISQWFRLCISLQ